MYYEIQKDCESKGMKFLKEITYSSSINSRALESIVLNSKGTKKAIQAVKNKKDNDYVAELIKTCIDNRMNNIFESIVFTKKFYKKDLKHRADLVELSKKHGFIFA